MGAQAKRSGVVRGTATPYACHHACLFALQEGQADVLGEILTSQAAG